MINKETVGLSTLILRLRIYCLGLQIACLSRILTVILTSNMDIAKLHLHWGASKYKGQTYRSYSLALPYRKGGKNRKEIVVKLGRLSEEKADRWRNVLKVIKKQDSFLTTADNIVVTNHYCYLDIAVVNALWDEWHLDEVFQHNGKRELGVATIARILTINRCLDPTSKSQTPQWFLKTALRWLLDVQSELINSSRIFRELTVIENHKEAICSHLFAKMMKDTPDSLKSVFYDLSSTTFTGSRCVLMKWGHCKEGYFNHVVLALVVNSDGLPFYWEILSGGTADAKTIIWLMERLPARFKLAETTLIFDRGIVSEENLLFLERAKIKYISAMDKNQLEGISSLDFSMFSHLNPADVDKQAADLPGFKKLNNVTYYREVKVEGTRRYILCFNAQLFKDQRQLRMQAIEEFSAYVKEMNEELGAAKNCRQRRATYEKFKKRLIKTNLAGIVDVRLKLTRLKQKKNGEKERIIRSYKGLLRIDETALQRAGRLDGFWMLVTNHSEKRGRGFKVPAEEAINPYRDKVVIESAFRDIKSFVEVAPVYVWTEAHVKAHYTICVLSHLINRTLTLRLHHNAGDATNDIVSHEKLYKKLSDCQVDQIEVENVRLSTFNLTRPTAEQKELLNRIGLNYVLSTDVIKKARAS